MVDTTPVGAALTTLASAYHGNRVTFTSVPEDCQPPRLVIEFDKGSELRAFVETVARIADLFPPPPQPSRHQ